METNLSVSGAVSPASLVIAVAPSIAPRVVQIVHVEFALVKGSFWPCVTEQEACQKKGEQEKVTNSIHAAAVASVVFPFALVVVAVAPVKLADAVLLVIGPSSSVHIAILPTIPLFF